jgi:hypothetical protein
MADSAGLEALFVRLYFDRHVMRRLAVDLSGRGFDVLTTEQAGKDRASDEEQLAYATAERRAILTFNIGDFASLHQQWQATGRHHAGIIASLQHGIRQYAMLRDRMLRLLNHLTADEMADNLVHLERFK